MQFCRRLEWMVPLEYDGGKVRFELVDSFRANERKPLMLTLVGSCFESKIYWAGQLWIIIDKDN